MEQSAEADLVDAGCNLKATVLKVGHHGSDTSSSYRFSGDTLIVDCVDGELDVEIRTTVRSIPKQ